MKNIFGIFRCYVRRITASVVSVIVIIGLCLVPCLYAWFNIMSNADPYGPASTSNIKVVVANEDEGSELLGLHFNIGDMVVDGISANDQMGWCFVDTREEAMDGLYAGDYYAALIVPSDFTKDFLSILDGDLIHPEVEYYENEKKNAIAPKITGKAKTAVQEQINSTIVEKVADVINTVSSIFKAMGLDADDVAEGLTRSMNNACNKLDQLCALLQSVQTLAGETQNLLDVVTVTIDDAGQVLADGSSVTRGVGNTAGAIYDASSTMQENFATALDDIDKNIADLMNLLRNWTGNTAGKDSILAYLDAADANLAAVSPLDASVPELLIAAAVSRTSSLRTLANSIDSANVRSQFTADADALSADMISSANYAADLANALNTAAAQAANIYNDISYGDADQAYYDLDALVSTLDSAGLSTYLNDDYSYAAGIKSSLAAAQNDAATQYASTLYDDLLAKSAELSSASSYLDGAAQNVSAASQAAAGYAGADNLYQQTLDLIDSIENSLNVLYDAANTAAVKAQIKVTLDAVAKLRNAIATTGDAGNVDNFLTQAEEIRRQLREIALLLNSSVNDRLQNAAQRAQDAMESLSGIMDSGTASMSDLAATVQRYSVAMGDAQLTLEEAQKLAAEVNTYVRGMAEDVRRMVDSEAFRQLMDILENNPDGLADYLVSPTDMRTVIVYEIADYGSAMSPYYIMLALFVGSLLTAAMIKPQIPYAEYEDAPQIQRYFGRLILFLCIGLFQALVTALGCLCYVDIQCVSPALFILGCMLISLNFVMMNYSLVYALDNIGLAASVIIMVIQVAGSGGSYPIHVLPQIFQDLYDFMPFHYGMDLIRETIGGFYQGTYARCALILLGMCVLFFVIGITLYYPARKLNQIIAESKEASGVM